MAKNPIELFKKFDGDGFPPIIGKSVYAVFVKASVFSGAWHLMYIGSSKNVEKRRNTAGHPFRFLSTLFPGSIVSLKCYLSDDHLEDEKILINHFKPILNNQHKHNERINIR